MRTGIIQSHSVGGAGLSGVRQGSGNPVDKNGDIWMTRDDPTDRGLLKIELNDPCAICRTEVWDYGEPPVSAKVSESMENKIGLTVQPNPFRSSVDICFRLKNDDCRVKIVEVKIYDINGKLLTSKINNIHSSLASKVRWNAQNQPPGTYLLKTEIGGRVMTKKLVLMR